MKCKESDPGSRGAVTHQFCTAILSCWMGIPRDRSCALGAHVGTVSLLLLLGYGFPKGRETSSMLNQCNWDSTLWLFTPGL